MGSNLGQFLVSADFYLCSASSFLDVGIPLPLAIGELSPSSQTHLAGYESYGRAD